MGYNFKKKFPENFTISGKICIFMKKNKMSKTTKIDRLNHQEIITKFIDIKNLKKVAKEFNISPTLVRKILLINNIQLDFIKTTKFDLIDHDEVIKLHRKECDLNKVAKELNISSTLVRKILLKNNINTSRQNKILSKFDDIKKIYEDKKSIDKVGKELNVSSYLVSNILKINNIEKIGRKNIKIGDVFGRLTVISRKGLIKTLTSHNIIFSCKCECGNIIDAGSNGLRRGKKSCGCLFNEIRHNAKEKKEKQIQKSNENKIITEQRKINKEIKENDKKERLKLLEMKRPKVGDKFNRWTILKNYNEFIKPTDLITVQCECGTIREILCHNLKYSKSCGCFQIEQSTKHGLCTESIKEYDRWKGMVSRCTKEKNHAYMNYGGRGIKVCDRWLEPNGEGCRNYINDIKEYLGEQPSPLHSIDRINNDGNYEITNIRWATPSEQSKNQRKRKKPK